MSRHAATRPSDGPRRREPPGGPSGTARGHGRAFPIADALVALRWAAQAGPEGYRVVVSSACREVDEAVEVYLPDSRVPTFRIYRGAGSVVVTDVLGLTLPFPTLVDALLAMAPLSRPEKRAVLKGGAPAWLPDVAGRPATTGRTGGPWRVARGAISRLASIGSGWGRIGRPATR